MRARWAVVPSLIALLPSAALFALPRPPFDEPRDVTYLRYKEVWGGNPNEVFSHFLDLVLMSGNAAVLAVLLVCEAYVRKPVPGDHQPIFFRVATAVGLVASGLVGVGLDMTYGEGTVLMAFPLFFLPMLLAARALLRRLAERVAWRVPRVAVIALVFGLLQGALQFAYEPSDNGGPNVLFLPLWLASLIYLSWDTVRKRRAHE